MIAELKGRHVALMFVTGFSIIIAVNVTMATNAVRTFPGLEVKNSYVASQSFDARRAAQAALGWQAQASYADNRLTLVVTDKSGRPVDPSKFQAVVGRPTTRTDDHHVSFDARGQAEVTLPHGLWRIDVTSVDGAPAYSHTLSLRVRP